MLSHLSIKNYILIRELEMDFRPGFTAITGETGAGKSILVGALSLILGKRADTDVLLDEQDKCVIEGVFRLSGTGLLPFFNDNDLDFEEQLVLRREIGNNGKSRAFINDTPVNLSLMRELGEKIVDIHSQHETLLLNESVFQLALIDSYAGIASLLEDMMNCHNKYIVAKRRLDDLASKERQVTAEADFLRYQFDELDKAGLRQDELSELEEEQKLLANAEEIKSILFTASQNMYAAEESLLDRFKEVTGSLGKISGFHAEVADLYNRLQSAQIELKDIGQGLVSLEEQINYDPVRLESVNKRIDLLLGFLHKHHVKELAELITIHDELGRKLSMVENIDEDLRSLEKEVEQAKSEMLSIADDLHNKRLEVLPAMEAQVASTLGLLGMEKSVVRVVIDSMPDCWERGYDLAEIHFSANPGVPAAPVSRIASGGELSRLMLALKSLITGKTLLPTIILDEIDMGVSGEIAGKVGKLLRTMAGNMQLIAITHLPQIAGMAEDHFRVYKKSTADRTVSGVKRLSDIERVEEIAGMLSNEKVTDAARATAMELLNIH